VARFGAIWQDRLAPADVLTVGRMISNRMPADPPSAPPADDRLDSWKEIAAYLRKGVRTVQRWERTERLPVRRHGQDRPGSVFAYKAELDSWLQEQSQRQDAQIALGVAPGPATAPRARWRLAAVATLILLVAAIVWTAWPTRPVAYHPVPLTADHGWETQPSFSPDARQIAYVWIPPGGRSAIYIKTIGADSGTRLTKGSQPEFRPAWSPDGRNIAFLRVEDTKPGVAVMLIPASGGTETTISELDSGSRLSWSADGQWLIAGDGPPEMRSIVAISVATGVKHGLTGRLEFGSAGEGLSPDSRRLVFSPWRPGRFTVYELALGPGLIPLGEPRRVTSTFWAREILVTPDAKDVILIDGSLEEGMGLWRLGLSNGAKPELIHGSTINYFNPAISLTRRTPVDLRGEPELPGGYLEAAARPSRLRACPVAFLQSHRAQSGVLARRALHRVSLHANRCIGYLDCGQRRQQSAAAHVHECARNRDPALVAGR
jgi:hypothetical protein